MSYTVTVHPTSRLETKAASVASMSSVYDTANDQKTLQCSLCTDNTCRNNECSTRPRKWTARSLESLKTKWRNLFRPVMKSSYSIPGPEDGWFRRLRYDMLLPTSGLAARVITLALLAFIIWAALWSVLSKEMLFHGNILGIYMVVLFALICGYLVEQVKLAPLLGE